MKINQKEWNAYVRWCKAEFAYMLKEIINDRWRITCEFSQEQSKSILDEWQADAETDYTYRKHHICFWQKPFRLHWPEDKKELKLVLLHEFCHQYFSPLADMAMAGNRKNDVITDLNERTTELIAHNYYKMLYKENGTRRFK